MKKLKLLAYIMLFGASHHPARGDEGQAPPSPPKALAQAEPANSVNEQTKPAKPPVPPKDYLKAGIQLFNKGRYELAGKYLAAAEMSRTQLTSNEQIVLDVYHEKLEQYLQSLRQSHTSPSQLKPPLPQSKALNLDPDLKTASLVGSSPGNLAAKMPSSPPTSEINRESANLEPPHGSTRGTVGWRDTSDTKQKGRWLLRLAREQIFRGHLDEAARSLAEVQQMNIHWGYFDDKPPKVAEALAAARDKDLKKANQKSAADRIQTTDKHPVRTRLRAALSPSSKSTDGN